MNFLEEENLTFFKVFGCKFFILNNGNENFGKFDPKEDEGPIPFGDWSRDSLPQFEQLSFLEHLNLIALSKVMVV